MRAKSVTRLSAAAMGLVLLALTSGCITTTTVPVYARSGDLVQVGLGGIKRNSSGKTLTLADVTATITDNNSDTYYVDVVQLFRAFPDYTSWYAQNSLDRDAGLGELEPYDGMWWATLRLTDSSGPLPLATGPASIAISSPELIDTGWQNEGTLSDFPIEIIAGTNTPTNHQQYQYFAYAPLRVLDVNPDNLTGVGEIGGFQLELTYNNSAVHSGGGAIVYPRVVPYSHDPNMTLIQSTVDNGDGTSTLTAFVTNPNGFVPNADANGSWTVGKSTFADLAFAIIVRDANNLDDGWESNYALGAANSFYIDTNGDPIPNLNPVLARSF